MDTQAPYDHADPRPSWSAVKAILDCPAEALWQRDQPRTESAAMATGTALHCAILEPAELSRRYAVPPSVVRLDGWEPVGARGAGYSVPALPGRHWPTKASAEADCRPWGWLSDRVPMPRGPSTDLCPEGEAPGYATQAEARSALGRLVSGIWTDAETLTTLRQLGDAARPMLPSGDVLRTEVALYGRLEGVECRGCADVIVGRAGRLLVVDVKTTADVSPRAVARSAAAGKWHGQLATYAMLALQQPQWAHLTLDDVVLGVLIVQAPACTLTGDGLRAAGRQPRPHARMEWLDAEATTYAYAQARAAWRTWRDCTATGLWPDHSGGLDVSRWQLAEAGDNGEDEEW